MYTNTAQNFCTKMSNVKYVSTSREPRHGKGAIYTSKFAQYVKIKKKKITVLVYYRTHTQTTNDSGTTTFAFGLVDAFLTAWCTGKDWHRRMRAVAAAADAATADVAFAAASTAAAASLPGVMFPRQKPRN